MERLLRELMLFPRQLQGHAKHVQGDKVLHLYVEVRNVDEKEQLGDNRSNLRMLQGPDVLPLRTEALYPPPTTALITPQKPSSIQSSEFTPVQILLQARRQLPAPESDDARCLSPSSHRDSLYGSVGHLSESRNHGTPHPGLSGAYCHYNDWGHVTMATGAFFPGVGRWSVPSSPATYRRLYDRNCADDDNGTTSVVRYGYVEKANVNQQPHWHNSKDISFLRSYPSSKRNSDPGWHRDPYQFTFSNYRPVHKPQNTPTFYRRGTLEAKDATHRALREFGSPELKRRYESYIQENNQHQQQSRLSWTSSPVSAEKAQPAPEQTQMGSN
ncbi:hypothetical protein WMY93_018328 [Mugilogobius chulae]|uniref:Uncharacterized protein n=1 Tax=Mugilogobius chulae TaxID=88201 RepID=A0AAW0NQ24_9GOBI